MSIPFMLQALNVNCYPNKKAGRPVGATLCKNWIRMFAP